MAVNLIDLLSQQFTGSALGSIASAVGEPEDAIRRAASGLAPALVGALAARAGTADGLGEIADLMRSGSLDSPAASTGLATALSSAGGIDDLVGRASPLLDGLFGGRMGQISDWLATFAGVRPKSASKLLALAAPLLLNLAGSQARRGTSLDLTALSSLLANQWSFLRDRAPAGLAAAIGVPSFTAPRVAAPASPAAAAAAEYARSGSSRGGLWALMLIPLLLLAAWWFFLRQPEGTVNPRLAIANDDGRITCTASVRNRAASDAIRAALRTAFGPEADCRVTIDPNVRDIAWLPNIDRVLAVLKRPGTEFRLDGESVEIGGWLSGAERRAMIDELRGPLGEPHVFAEDTGKATAYASAATDRALAALAAIGGTFSARAFADAMNLAVINFATGSADVPPGAQDLIARAAAALRSAPGGTRIEIAGHTDNVGDAAANQALSEARANAVRAALVTAGVNADMLVAKGYGDTRPAAANDTEYGRFRNRRIEYSVLAGG